MKNSIIFLCLLFLLCALSCSEPQPYKTLSETVDGYTYEYVDGDKTNTRIYTLKNGLKVYLSDYKNEPRIQVYIPVKAGGKNDPASNTGLAHYLEHMMFKGNHLFGTIEYEAEKIMLDSIERMFNYYATLTDAEDRKVYYAKIDAYSNEAAKWAIPNEYDKMIATLGGKGLNAYTTEDRTVYTVDIPSNELERFFELEGSRFRKIVNRLFHTELEAVYEEKNMSLDNDQWKVFETMYTQIFENHPYGTQTVIGTIEHLKNPSITEIIKYFNTYYRPNNVAICMSGDLDYSKTIKLIDQYFGDWQPNDQLPNWEKIEELPITHPKEVEVVGPDAEFLQIGFRLGGTASPDYIKAQLIDMLLNNSEAGLIDLNLKQKQTVLDAGCFVNNMNDYSIHTFYGYAKQGQSLEEVKSKILEQIEKVKRGEFEDWLVTAVINDFKKRKMESMQSNWSRADNMVMAFTNNIPWAEYISTIDKMEKLTREDLIAFANEIYKDNYVVVYKRTGEDPNKQQVEKPQITKVPVNRDQASDFQKKLADKKPEKLNPVFVDYQKDIIKSNINNVEVLYSENTENSLFDLVYLFDLGKNADPKISVAVQYLEFLGTDQFSDEEIKMEFYKIGCSFSVFASDERTYVTLSGLDENMEKATVLFESLLATPLPNQAALDKLVDRILKRRSDDKKDKGTILWNGLYNYAKYGSENPFTNVLDNYELKELQAEELTQMIQKLTKWPHRILYYGPRNEKEVSTYLEKYHPVPTVFTNPPQMKEFEEMPIEESAVYWADYDMTQSEIIFLAKSLTYDPSLTPQVRLFNEYFGGGMNSIVFQEIREAQGLAYSVFSSYSEPSKMSRANYLYAYVGIQSDKQIEAMEAMKNLLNNMPESKEAFQIAKEAILSKIESERITRSSVLWNYVNAQDKGLTYDIRKDIYEDVKAMTFEDLLDFHTKYIKDQKYLTVLVGSRDKINFSDLAKYGQVKEVSLDELFGYKDSENITKQ